MLGTPYTPNATRALLLGCGELGKEILKSGGYGSAEARRTDSLETEMGDALFSLLCLANGLDISLEQALDRVLAKYEARFSEKGDIGSGR